MLKNILISTMSLVALAAVATLLGIALTMDIVPKDQASELRQKAILYEQASKENERLKFEVDLLEDEKGELLSVIKTQKEETDSLYQELRSAYTAIEETQWQLQNLQVKDQQSKSTTVPVIVRLDSAVLERSRQRSQQGNTPSP